MGDTCGVGTTHSSRVPESFSGVPVAGSLVFCVMAIALSVLKGQDCDYDKQNIIHT
jgi:hypothetical protein